MPTWRSRRDEARLRRHAAELAGGHGVRTRAVVADLAAADGPGHAVRSTIAQLGRVDVLVNNAGASPFGSFDRISDDQWSAAFELKLLGYVRCIRAVLPGMRAQRSGRIVNVVGMAGHYATSGYVLGALNAALLHLTRSVADLVAQDGITVVALNPGFTATDRLTAALSVLAEEAGTDLATFSDGYLAERVPLGLRGAAGDRGARRVRLLAALRLPDRHLDRRRRRRRAREVLTCRHGAR